MRQDWLSRYEASDAAALLAALPATAQRSAGVGKKNFALLKVDPQHASLHFKKVGKRKQLWSVRVGEHYRALGTDKPEGAVWFWIGTHAEYDKLLS